jgi:hypothetical protein
MIMADIRLKDYTVPVKFKDGSSSVGRAEGIVAAWQCQCGEALPLVGRAYFQFGHDCHTVCSACNRSYRVMRDQQKRTSAVEEI